MAGGTIWKGYVHFKDTDIPVKLHSAVREERTHFHLLHKRDNARLRQQMVCAYEKQPVPTEEQSKGYEVEKGKYILVGPEEIELTVPESSRMIEVHEFVKTSQIDPIYIDRVYHLGPDITGIQEKTYQAFVRALKDMEVEGICTWTMRNKTYLGALQARGKGLRLNTLRYADEVVSVASLGLQDVPLSEKELKIGSDLINQLTGPFEPQKFENEHEKKLRNMIEKKARGEKIAVLAPRRLKPTQPDQLIEILQASLKKAA
jgi:DNA end-binding protein Ku